MEQCNVTDVLVSCLLREFSGIRVLDIAAFTALALKDPIASLQIMKRKLPAPSRSRTPVMLTIINPLVLEMGI